MLLILICTLFYAHDRLKVHYLLLDWNSVDAIKLEATQPQTDLDLSSYCSRSVAHIGSLSLIIKTMSYILSYYLSMNFSIAHSVDLVESSTETRPCATRMTHLLVTLWSRVNHPWHMQPVNHQCLTCITSDPNSHSQCKENLIFGIHEESLWLFRAWLPVWNVAENNSDHIKTVWPLEAVESMEKGLIYGFQLMFQSIFIIK